MHEELEKNDLHAVSHLSYRPADPPDLAPQDNNNVVPTDNTDILRHSELPPMERAEDQITIDPSYTPRDQELEATELEATEVRRSARGHKPSWKYLERYDMEDQS